MPSADNYTAINSWWLKALSSAFWAFWAKQGHSHQPTTTTLSQKWFWNLPWNTQGVPKRARCGTQVLPPQSRGSFLYSNLFPRRGSRPLFFKLFLCHLPSLWLFLQMFTLRPSPIQGHGKKTDTLPGLVKHSKKDLRPLTWDVFAQLQDLNYDAVINHWKEKRVHF